MNEDTIKEFETEMARQIQKEIDNEIMGEMLVLSGRHRVDLPSNTTESGEVIMWCAANTKGNYKNLWPSMIFKEEKDAVLFKLKWA